MPLPGRSATRRGLLGLLGQVARRVRHRGVVTQLRGRSRPASILIVCTGNACRSPYMSAVLAARMPDVRVESAGFLPAGRSSPPLACSTAASRGIDLTGHRSRRLIPAIVGEADVVVVMSRRHHQAVTARYGTDRPVILAGDLDPDPSHGRDIPDPYTGDADTFERVFARLDRCADMFLNCFSPVR